MPPDPRNSLGPTSRGTAPETDERLGKPGLRGRRLLRLGPPDQVTHPFQKAMVLAALLAQKGTTFRLGELPHGVEEQF
ncbi:MAG: hypothetical protein KDA27_28420, partial [Candidatus Eisenbacteria bacterium]|nr:hypothetical protein [Candidatus Eisenbacteria bacterium]